MAEPDEVPDHLKDPAHTIPLEDWKRVKANAAKYAALEAPPSEDDEDDEEALRWL